MSFSPLAFAKSHFVRPLAWAMMILPALFLFVMIQYSAILFPFWDHVELTLMFERFYNHQLQLADFFQPHNHARPVFYHLIYFFSGILTRWDIRAEYPYMIATIHGGFVLLFLTFKKTLPPTNINLVLAGLAAMFYFSPTGHNNHWWSLMMMMNLAVTFVMAAFLILGRNPMSLKVAAGVVAFVFCSAFSVTNAIILLPIFSVVTLIANDFSSRAKKISAIYFAFFLILIAIYIPGLGPSGSPQGRPSLLEMFNFCALYIGVPLGNLLDFSFISNFDLPTNPRTTGINFVAGIFTGLVCVFLIYKNWCRRASAAFQIAVASICFAFGSALMTAYGRANFDSYGIHNANASRYSVFSNFAIYGALILVALNWPFFRIRTKKILAVSFAFFVLVAASAYRDSFRVYDSSRKFNHLLARVYNANAAKTVEDQYVYPDPLITDSKRATMKNYKFGPYRYE